MNVFKKILFSGFVLVSFVAWLLVLAWLLTSGIFAPFFLAAQPEFIIPGLGENYVPQGFSYLEKPGVYLMSGYMSDRTSSRIYCRSAGGGITCATLWKQDGTPYKGHAGGVCGTERFVYLAGHHGIDVFPTAAILAGGPVQCLGTIETGYGMAYCSIEDGFLLSGNFYHPNTYETPDVHRITTPAGEHNTSIITVFKADDQAEFGFDPVPVAAISAPDRVQGLCAAEGQLVLSTSYSLRPSQLLYYAPDLTNVGSFEILDTQVPLYYLEKKDLTHSVTLPPMSEELVYKDGRVLVMCESASNKYFYGKFIRGDLVYSYAPR